MNDIRVAIQYPSFGPQHPPRLAAIVKSRATPGSQVIAMEMFKKDSDYEWRSVATDNPAYLRYTVMDCESAVGRKDGTQLTKAVGTALDDIDPDVLVVNGWGHRESRISLRWCRQHQCKVVLLSDSVRENRRRFWPLEQYKKWIVRGIKAGFAAGTPQAEYLNFLGIPKNNVYFPGSCVVDNRYWAEKSMSIRKTANECRMNFALPAHYFLCVARFVGFKNIPLLVRAYGQYRKIAAEKAIDLVLCGSGPEERMIKTVIDKLGLSASVHLYGFRQVDELPVYYSLASCFILPSSRFECWGFVVNEAMASGLPVLVSKMVGCARDLVQPGINGYTFDPHDAGELAGLMQQIVGEEETRAAMGACSAKIIRNHTPEIGAEMLWKAVEKALNN